MVKRGGAAPSGGVQKRRANADRQPARKEKLQRKSEFSLMMEVSTLGTGNSRNGGESF
jgi:hypothetical protein